VPACLHHHDHPNLHGACGWHQASSWHFNLDDSGSSARSVLRRYAMRHPPLCHRTDASVASVPKLEARHLMPVLFGCIECIRYHGPPANLEGKLGSSYLIGRGKLSAPADLSSHQNWALLRSICRLRGLCRGIQSEQSEQKAGISLASPAVIRAVFSQQIGQRCAKLLAGYGAWIMGAFTDGRHSVVPRVHSLCARPLTVIDFSAPAASSSTLAAKSA